MENAAINAGNSEKSILMKLGINGTLKLNIINTADNAPNKPVIVIVLTLIFFSFLFVISSISSYYFFEISQEIKAETVKSS